MTTWGLVPIKELSQAKSSLAKVFEPEQRRELVLAMLTDVLNAFRGAAGISGFAVVSPDTKVLDFARQQGAVDILEKDLGLNGALKLATRQLIGLGAASVLITSGDLPFLKHTDVENITAMATGSREVVITPSNANGTNALFLRPPEVIELKFGGESFPVHLAEAVRAGLRPRIYRSSTVALDIDEPGDLIKVETLGLGTKTHEFLLSLLREQPALGEMVTRD